MDLIKQLNVMDVPKASEAEVRELSVTFNAAMARRARESIDQNDNFFRLFKHVDSDNSGRISYKELLGMIREELLLKPADLPEARVKAVWKALDADLGGFLTAGEFGAFMRKGERACRPKWEASCWRQRRRIARRIFVGP